METNQKGIDNNTIPTPSSAKHNPIPVPTPEERQKMLQEAWDDWKENVVKKYLIKTE